MYNDGFGMHLGRSYMKGGKYQKHKSNIKNNHPTTSIPHKSTGVVVYHAT